MTERADLAGIGRRIAEIRREIGLTQSEFEIYDIIVPPHVVTGSTVTADYTKYSEWLNALEDDVFNSLHFHGHSHVNMACSPSGTDMKYRQDVVTQLPVPKNETDDSFYIFCIFNKDD